MKCPKCGTTVKDDAKFCFACGAKLEQPKALAEPEKIEVQHVKMKPEAPKAKKKGNNKKVGKIVVAVGVCAAVVVVGVNIVPRLTQTDNPCVYLSDGSYNLLTKMKKDSGVDFADGVSTAVFENSPYTIKGRTQFSPSGKYLYFYNNYDGNGGTLCRIRWDKIKKNSSGSRDYENIETIGSNISDTYNIYRLISDDEVIYKDTSDSLYYYNGEETTKIAKQAADFWVDENGRIVYTRKDDESGEVCTLFGVTTKEPDNKIKLASNIAWVVCADDLDNIFVRTNSGEDNMGVGVAGFDRDFQVLSKNSEVLSYKDDCIYYTDDSGDSLSLYDYVEGTDVIDTLKEPVEEDYQITQDTGNEGITQLQKLEDVWVNKVQPAEKACQERKDTLQSKGEDISELNELEEEENIKINTDDLEDMLNCLERNTEEAEGLLEEAEKMIQVTDHIKAAQINSTEACSIFERGAAAAVNTFWDDNANFGMPLQGNYYYTDPKECNFYKEYLSKVGTKSEDETEQNAKDQKKQDAEDAQGEYDQILEGLNALGKEKNLKDFSGLSYPDEFPSGQNKIGSDIQSAQTVKKLNLDSDDTTVNDGAGSLSAITELLKGLDNLSGELLERAYLMEYMSEMFNCMTTKENDVSLSNDKLNSHYIYNGEIEYLLYGNESTIVNKTEATAVLYSLRLAINSAYVFFDKTLNAEANSIASGISAATGQAWLYPIIKYSYLFCCAVVYSGQDLSSLMKGDEVAVWRANDKVKLNYKEYLKLFLLVSMISENNEKKLLVRTADCIQLNTGKSLSSKYTMLTLRADVKAETTFLPKVPALLGRSNSDEESQKMIKYQGILGY